MGLPILPPKPEAPGTLLLEPGKRGSGEGEHASGEDGIGGQFFEILAAALSGNGEVSFFHPEGGEPPADGSLPADEGGNSLPLASAGFPTMLPGLANEAASSGMVATRLSPAPLAGGLSTGPQPILPMVKNGEARLLPSQISPLNAAETTQPLLPVQQLVPSHLLQSVLPPREAAAFGETGPGQALLPLPPFSPPGAAAPSPAPVMPPSFPLSPPLGSPQWQNALGERLVWLVKKDLQQAELRLNPQHLGPVEVRIEVRNEHATISFSAHHAVTRDVLEASVPRLREMLGEAGVTLASVDVSQQRSGHGHHEGRERGESGGSAPTGGEGIRREEGPALHAKDMLRGTGLIDLFA